MDLLTLVEVFVVIVTVVVVVACVSVSLALFLVGFLNLCLPGVRSFKSANDSHQETKRMNHKLSEWTKVN